MKIWGYLEHPSFGDNLHLVIAKAKRKPPRRDRLRVENQRVDQGLHLRSRGVKADDGVDDSL
jgi:hypothetical protein